MERSWKSVEELLGPRRGIVFSVPAEATVHAALEMLAEKDVGMLVVQAGDKPVGIFSERDLARKVELHGRTARDTRVHEVMTPEVLYVTPAHTIDRCMLLMKKDRVRHLVVVEDGRVVGVVSARDILEDAVAEEEERIRELKTDRLVMTTYTGAY
ncbi:MAG TPA: CBS domain-containing protein [Crenalkalicoccus sp.]|nr:CBS domain-containing protein [Crenalkalicoccus sp.]